MTEFRSADDGTLAALYELFASATHDASAAMCRWTNGLITVTLDQVREIALEDVSTELGIGDELLTMVVTLGWGAFSVQRRYSRTTSSHRPRPSRT
jgi:chemotaxis protein CheC